MLKIGLTGGIGCGKTTVAGLFAAYGVPIIDADAVARALVEPGRPAFDALRKQFGETVFNNDGRLDRSALREMVFADPAKRKLLESLLHPLVYEEMQRRLAALNCVYALLCIPLLLETGKQGFVDRIAVVDCPESMQIERAKQRDGLPESGIRAIMQAQVSRQQRLAAADDIIDNSGTAIELAEQIEKLHNLYLTLHTS